MRQSQLFSKVRREAPSDELARNATLLIRAGFVSKVAAGIYAFLPLGLAVLERINTIIREEMRSLGAEELLLSALQNPEPWRASERWEEGVWFKTTLTDGGVLGLGWTHEEALTAIACQHIHSYRDLPIALFQIQTKFRNEERAKSGVLRGREFVMKDLYSFHTNEEDLDRFYEAAALAYEQVFRRVGLGALTFRTTASGGAFAPWSHEFQTLAEAGEDTIYVHRGRGIAVNKEVYTPELLTELRLEKDELEECTAIEVGNIFKLGTRFSKPLGLEFSDEGGTLHPVVMGSYGIGPSRLLGTVAEVLSDERGLVWPEEIAPARYHLVALSGKDVRVQPAADALYDALVRAGIPTLYDDRELSAGEKFAEADLIGIPYRIVVSAETIKKGLYELRERATGTVRYVHLGELTAP